MRPTRDVQRRLPVRMIIVTPQARAALDDDEVLVIDWHSVAMCCAAAGEVSLRPARRSRVAGSFRPLPTDEAGATRVLAHRAAYPHLVPRNVTIDVVRRRGRRHFIWDLPADFGLRAVLGRLPAGLPPLGAPTSSRPPVPGGRP